MEASHKTHRPHIKVGKDEEEEEEEFLEPFLNNGMMFASFHSKGIIPSCSDMLNTCASGVLIFSTVVSVF